MHTGLLLHTTLVVPPEAAGQHMHANGWLSCEAVRSINYSKNYS